MGTPDASLTWEPIQARLTAYPAACPICGSARGTRQAGGPGRRPKTCGGDTCRTLYRAAYVEAHASKRPRRKARQIRQEARIRYLEKEIAAKGARLDRLAESLRVLRDRLDAAKKEADADLNPYYCGGERSSP